MARPGLRQVARYGEEFKVTAVKVSSLREAAASASRSASPGTERKEDARRS